MCNRTNYFSHDLHLLLGIDAVKGAATGIEEYNPRSNKWTHLTTMETRRLQFGVAIVNGKLYVTGNVGLSLSHEEELKLRLYDSTRRRLITLHSLHTRDPLVSC